MPSFFMGVLATLFCVAVAWMASGSLRLGAEVFSVSFRTILACRIEGVPPTQWADAVRAAVSRIALAAVGDRSDSAVSYFVTRVAYETFREEYAAELGESLRPWGALSFDDIARWRRVATRVVEANAAHYDTTVSPRGEVEL